MKANGAPEKIYIFDNPILDFTKLSIRQGSDDIEYIRTDAFIEKAWNWIEDNMLSINQQDRALLYYRQFINYMEGE